MHKSTITIEVHRDGENIPEHISWNATDSTAESMQKAKAMCVSFWDAEDRSALSLDLWTKEMMVDEMADFFYQMLITMSQTFERATRQAELSNDMKTFANNFIKKFHALQMKDQNP